MGLIQWYLNKFTNQTLVDKVELEALKAKIDKPRVLPYRRCGNTTRLVDYYIQELFNTGETRISDHYGTRQASEHLLRILLKRIDLEHYIKYDVDKNRDIKIKLRTNVGY